MCTYMHWLHITIIHGKSHSKSITHGIHKMTCDHDMMLMNEHDNAYVDAMLMIIMQANTRSVTAHPPYKNLVLRFERRTIFHRMRGKLLVNRGVLHLRPYTASKEAI